MAYSTAAKVRELLQGVLASNDTMIGNMITRADSIIDSKVGLKYSVPFATTPPVIETISTELAAYFVMRTLFTQDSQNKNEWITTFKECIKQLDMIAEGSMAVLDSAGAQLAFSGDPVTSDTKDYAPVFNMDEIENQGIDPDLTDDIADERD